MTRIPRTSLLVILLCCIFLFCPLGCSQAENQNNYYADAVGANGNKNSMDDENENTEKISSKDSAAPIESDYKEQMQNSSTSRIDDALTFLFTGKEIKMWTTTFSEVLPQITSTINPIQCETGPVPLITDMYYDGYEQELVSAYGSSNSIAAYECPIEELASRIIPGKSYIQASFNISEFERLAIVAVNRDGAEHQVGECAIVSMSLETNGNTSGKYNLSYGDIGIGSSLNDVIVKLGQPQDETYEEQSVWNYYLDHGDVSTTFSNDHVSSITVGNLYVMNTTEIDLNKNADLLNEMRTAPILPWEKTQVTVSGINIVIGQTLMKELEAQDIAFEDDLDATIDGDVSVVLADHSGYIVCRGPGGSNIRNSTVIGVYAMTEGEAEAISIGGLSINSKIKDLPKTFGRANTRSDTSCFWNKETDGASWDLNVTFDGETDNITQIGIGLT